jgi:hypothetical protein
MNTWMRRLTMACLLTCACDPAADRPSAPASSPVSRVGTLEVSARLMEIPEGAIFKRDLYDYATILKYEVLRVHRGDLTDSVIHVAHYNPWKPRRDAQDRRVPEIGGNLEEFQTGQVHHMALEHPVEDFFMGGLVNKYFGTVTNSLYWAVWTDRE